VQTPDFTAAKDLTPDRIQFYLDLYLRGLIAAVQAVLPGMIERGHDSIVFVNAASALGAPPTMRAALRRCRLGSAPSLAAPVAS
jgi:NADP-dependent 3-hydroxy acid dehydrogenase YdfG